MVKKDLQWLLVLVVLSTLLAVAVLLGFWLSCGDC